MTEKGLSPLLLRAGGLARRMVAAGMAPCALPEEARLSIKWCLIQWIGARLRAVQARRWPMARTTVLGRNRVWPLRRRSRCLDRHGGRRW